MNKFTICMLQSFNRRLDSVSSRYVFWYARGIPYPSGKQWKSDRTKTGWKIEGESLQASFYTRQSVHYQAHFQKNRFTCQNDKW